MPFKINMKGDLFYKQGQIETKRQVVINLLEMKYATQQIVDIVNVTEDFVREVASSLKQGNNKK